MTTTLTEQIAAALALDPDKGAIEFKGHWTTWRDVASLMDRVEALVADSATEPGAPIGLILRNRTGQMAAALQVLRSRRCLVTINPFQGPDKLAADLRALRLPVVIADAQDWAAPEILEAARECGSCAIELGSAPGLDVRAVPGLERRGAGPFHDPLPDVSVLMLTSGTTGPAKRVKLPYRQLEQAFASAAHYERKRPDDGSAKRAKEIPALLTTPLVHIGGLYMALDAVLACRPLVLMEKFNVAEWADAMLRHRPKTLSLPPTAIRMIVDAQVPVDVLQSVKAVRTGSAPLPPELQTKFEAIYGVPLLNTYGATEFAGAVAGWSLKDHQEFGAAKLGAVGRAQPGCELRVVDRETGAVLPAGAQGVLEVRSNQVAGGQWARTTDLAELDADGFLFIRGRADDAIIRGGFKVLPRDVEALLRKHPAVREAIVVGVPDERLGAVPVAAVELYEEGPAATPEELIAFIRKDLVSYQVPVQLKILPALPRTPSLKISQHEVKALFRAA